jgi:hypothetical protein
MKLTSTILALILALAGIAAMVIDARQEPDRKSLRAQSQRLAATAQLPVDDITASRSSAWRSDIDLRAHRPDVDADAAV